MKVLFLSSGRRAKEIETALRKNGINVVTKISRKWNLFSNIIYALFNKFDIIHADDALFNGFVACFAAKLSRKKSTCIIRGYGTHIQKQKRYGLFKRIILNLAEKVSFRHMDHIFFISRNTEEEMKKRFKIFSSTSIAPNGINIPEEYIKKDLRRYIEEKTNKKVKKKDIILTTVTNLKFKEKAEGIEILKKMMNHFPSNIWLIIFGDGKYLKKCSENSSENVIFAGYKKDIHEWISDSDIFVYCSFLDSLGQVMLEAQVAGLPLVASAVGGIKETTKYGILCKPSPKDFAESLRPLIQLKKMREEQGEKNKKWIEKKSWFFTTKKYISVWNELLKK